MKVRGIELIIFGAQIGRNNYRYKKALTVLLRRFIEEAFYIGLPLYVLYSNENSCSILNLYFLFLYISVYIVLWILLQTFYDFFYALNDCVFAKYEELPTFREYCRRISLKRLLVLRFIYVCLLMYFLVYFFYLKLENLVIALALITYAMLLHNLTRINLWRIFTFSAVRLSRWVFIPTALGAFHVIPLLMIVLIPYSLLVIIDGYKYELRKYGISVPVEQTPLWLVYSAFIPITLLLLYPNNLLALLPNCITIFISLYRRAVKAKLK